MAQQADETVLQEAKELLVQGKRFMALEDYQSATDYLEQSCQLFDAFHGVAKRPCADAYLEYGLALVALANLEAGSGTDKIMKKAGITDDDEESDEEEEGADEEEEAEAEADQGGEGSPGESAEAEKKEDDDVKMDVSGEEKKRQQDEDMISTTNGETTTTKTNGVTEATKKTDDNTEAAQDQQPQASSSTSEPQPGTSTGIGGDNQDGDKGDDSEDVDNEEATTIEVAWEVLCLAKRLFMDDESLEGRLKLAETLQKLGEISIEWDNNDNAVSILEECLKIRKAILNPGDRLIALTYYHLGLAHSFKSDTQSANENFQNAINVIEHRIETLADDLKKAKSAQDTVAIGQYQKEINELKELLPDMTMRLDDSKEDDSIKSTEVFKRTREELQLEDEEAKKVCSDKSKPVDDISHLVKRKAT